MKGLFDKRNSEGEYELPAIPKKQKKQQTKICCFGRMAEVASLPEF